MQRPVSSRGLLPIFSGLVLSLVGCVGAAGAETKPDQTLAHAGRRLYAQYCISCHGSDAKGNGPVSISLLTTPADLTTIAARRDGTFPSARIAEIIDGRAEIHSHGTREMPVWGRHFSERFGGDSIGESAAAGEVAALVAYLRSIQVEKAAEDGQ